MTSESSYDELRSGRAWSTFCRELDEIGSELFRPEGPDEPVDVAEAYRFLTRMLRSAFELTLESGDASKPSLSVSLHETVKVGWDNPDNIHLNAYISNDHTYRLHGRRGDAHTVSVAIYGGSYGKKEAGRRTVAFVDLDDLAIAADGSFEIVVGGEKRPGNWIALEPGATTLMIRQTCWDRRVDAPGQFELEAIDRSGPVPALDPGFVAAALRRTSRYIRGSNRLFFDLSDHYRKDALNLFEPSDPVRMVKNQGIPYNQLSSGWWRFSEGEAAVIDFVAPSECPYWMFVLSNYWGESFDYRHHPIHTNNRLVTRRPDGGVRLVVAGRDPGLADAHWIDTAGHAEGVWQFRWYHLEGLPPCPPVRIVSFDELSSVAWEPGG
jgi:hypothetical protein